MLEVSIIVQRPLEAEHFSLILLFFVPDWKVYVYRGRAKSSNATDQTVPGEDGGESVM